MLLDMPSYLVDGKSSLIVGKVMSVLASSRMPLSDSLSLGMCMTSAFADIGNSHLLVYAACCGSGEAENEVSFVWVGWPGALGFGTAI